MSYQPQESGSGPREIWVPDTKDIIECIDDEPHGFPKMARFIDSTANLLVFRRFGYLRVRLIQYYQSRITELENKLRDMDGEDSREGRLANICCRQQDDAQVVSPRKQLFHELLEDLQIYDELLERSSKMYEFPEPTARNRCAVGNMMHNDGCLCQEDRNYIRHVDDLIALAGEKQRGLVSGYFEGLMRGNGKPIGNALFKKKVQRMKSKDKFIELYSDIRVARLVAIFLGLLITGLLMIPIFVLSEIANESTLLKNVVIFIFAFLFATVCSLSTMAKRQEIFVGTATYCAVLVVFVSQAPSSPSTNACSCNITMPNGTKLGG